ncbi:hypothetical protein IEO21_06924 [Rhodonia placenta]|uniref:Secreted protein n=1 Tax=Rhodonia placenta TaxID=104341 RepID=A0A8H7U054_9APHY|nr:hypothetical protein IEO21_06924 [Postia placenta]
MFVGPGCFSKFLSTLLLLLVRKSNLASRRQTPRHSCGFLRSISGWRRVRAGGRMKCPNGPHPTFRREGVWGRFVGRPVRVSGRAARSASQYVARLRHLLLFHNAG